MQEVIKVEHLSKSYGEMLAVDNVSLSVKRGTVFGLLGANGAGKSTTIECILGTKKANKGLVSILDCDPRKERRRIFQKVGVQFQECDYQPEIRVSELCEETACLYTSPADWRKLCRQFGIGEKENSAVKSLSGGERQRLFIVLALIPNPEIVFLALGRGGRKRMRSFRTLLKNELKLNIRNMNMVIFAIILPLVVLVILGFIYGTKPAAEGVAYSFMDQSLGALCSISICAGGLMGLPLVVSEYRERKILKRFKVTPISPVLLLIVEFLIYVLYTLVSMVTLILTSKIFWDVTIHGSWFGFLGSWALTVFSTLSIGLMVGGVAKTAKSASVIACILYFPMLIFSGATLPIEVMPSAMQKVISVFPLTQGIQLMKATSLGLSTENILTPIIVMVVVTMVCIGIAIKCFRWE